MAESRLPRMHRLWVTAPLLIVVALLAATLPEPAVAEADAVTELVKRADRKLRTHRYADAVEMYAEADRLADGRSLPAVAGLARSSLGLLRYDDAIGAAERWIGMAPSPETRAAGYQVLGLTLHRRGLSERWAANGGPGSESLRAAADAFRQALEILGDDSAGRPALLLNLADTLSWLGEREETGALLDSYAAAGGTDPYAEELRCWATEARETEISEKPAVGLAENTEEDLVRQPMPVFGSGIEPPKKLFAPAPQYTKEARAARLEGTVVVQAIITKQGELRCVRPVQGHFLLAQMALATLKKSRFEPARQGGTPIDVYFNLSVDFTLKR
jgi:TonB family protein